MFPYVESPPVTLRCYHAYSPCLDFDLPPISFHHGLVCIPNTCISFSYNYYTVHPYYLLLSLSTMVDGGDIIIVFLKFFNSSLTYPLTYVFQT
jgi:hypothetical protein